MEDKTIKLFKDKLYLDPIESINSSRFKLKGYRIKGDSSKEQDKIKVLKSLPNVQTNQLQISKSQSKRQIKEKPLLGSVIIQNWTTVKNVPEDIGDLINFPVLIDRKKYRYKDFDGEGELKLPEDKKLKFSKLGIIKRGEKMLKLNQNQKEPITITSPNYLPSQSTNAPIMSTEQTEETEEPKPFSSQLHAIKVRSSESQALIISDRDKEKANLIEIGSL